MYFFLPVDWWSHIPFWTIWWKNWTKLLKLCFVCTQSMKSEKKALKIMQSLCMQSHQITWIYNWFISARARKHRLVKRPFDAARARKKGVNFPILFFAEYIWLILSTKAGSLCCLNEFRASIFARKLLADKKQICLVMKVIKFMYRYIYICFV